MRSITIYSTPTCPFCQKLKAFLKEKDIAYTDYDVSVDEVKRAEMEKLSGSLSVPVIVFDKDTETQEVQTGFDQEKIEQALSV